ncbi:hydroxyacylglutathione hydrolase [Ideonella sp. BN130291]|uniref:hydroxyacylglutathione hydrolase n=1 Tax=Ideonella sp. BN130291 TaxID=3112940 RepID=UPI002E2660DC|nr:hydroxyacylglutathione hydrolase [Ideonella sp. BN130291]
MQLIALPAFADNYIWMLHDGEHAIVVDPGDDQPVKAALSARGLQLSGILVTHHHADHVGGLAALQGALQGPIYGPANEAMPLDVIRLRDGDTAELLGLRFDVIDVPGHTAGHIAYFHTPEADDPILFCGDTLFSAGCGRLFEGTPRQMHASLARLAALPDATRVCCAHEYTLSNLRFAHAVEPMNDDVVRHTAWCETERAAGRPTLPSRMARERRINPFLRCDAPAVVAAAQAQGAADRSGPEVFTALRRWKDHFR